MDKNADGIPKEVIDREATAAAEEAETLPGGDDPSDFQANENEASLLEKRPPLSIQGGGDNKTTTGLSANGKCTDKAAAAAGLDVVERPVPQRRMDGGFRAWLIVFSSFMCNGLIFGVINSYSLIYVELKRRLEFQGVSDASGKAGTFIIVLNLQPTT